jgi:hypothetical protein
LNAGSLDQPDIATFGCGTEMSLIQEYLALMATVRQVVNHEDALRYRTHLSLPIVTEAVVIDYQPVDAVVAQVMKSLLRVFFFGNTWPRITGPSGRTLPRKRCTQPNYPIAFVFYS